MVWQEILPDCVNYMEFRSFKSSNSLADALTSAQRLLTTLNQCPKLYTEITHNFELISQRNKKEIFMITFETVNELTLKVTSTGGDVLFTKAGAFIAGDNAGQKNYKFEKVMLGPNGNIGQALFGQIVRRMTGENIPLMKVNFHGASTTYYASYGQHVVVYHLAYGETISVESENILAFTADCDYKVRFVGVGVLSQKGLATTAITGRGDNSYVAVLSDGNPIVLSNVGKNNTISVDPDAVICWMGNGHCDPSVTADVSWKTFIGQTSGESYQFEWRAGDEVTVIIQPSERRGGISVSVD